MIKPELEAYVFQIIGEVICGENEVGRQLEQGKSIAESNKWLYDVAVAIAQSYDEQLCMRMDAYDRERAALAEVNVLKQEIADLKVPDYRQN